MNNRDLVINEIIKGDEYRKLLQYNEAILHYSQAINHEPDFYYPYYLRCLANFKLGKLDNVIADASQALSLNPHSPDTESIHRIRKLAGLKILKQYYLDKKFLADTNTDTILSIAGAYEAIHDYTNAILFYNRLIELEPTHSQAYCLRGNLYFSQGNYSLALYDYKQAIDITANDPVLYYNRALTCRKLSPNSLSEAIGNLCAAITLDPHYTLAKKALSSLLKAHTTQDIFEEICKLPEKTKNSLLEQCQHPSTILGHRFTYNIEISGKQDCCAESLTRIRLHVEPSSEHNHRNESHRNSLLPFSIWSSEKSATNEIEMSPILSGSNT